jgi:hypothetical protein
MKKCRTEAEAMAKLPSWVRNRIEKLEVDVQSWKMKALQATNDVPSDTALQRRRRSVSLAASRGRAQIGEQNVAQKKATKKATSPFTVGNKVFIRTVTNYFVGEIVAVDKDEILLKNASWVASTKRWADTIANGALDEVEPYPEGMIVSVNRGAYVDACEWRHELPRKQR